MTVHEVDTEIASGQRFAFGANWLRFIKQVDEPRIEAAESSIRQMLGVPDLQGLSFLDIGSGSGLFSLAAARLGATVTSFDYDGGSVRATEALSRRLGGAESGWKILQGSVLDQPFLSTLGVFDVVYAWGVLHHTGDMWDAMENVVPLVKADGLLFISIYNDQGARSVRWRSLKRRYVSSRRFVRGGILAALWIYFSGRGLAARVVNRTPETARSRGMARWRDLVDWAGGYPFEVAPPESVFSFFRERGFVLERLVTKQGIGCNEFVFRRG